MTARVRMLVLLLGLLGLGGCDRGPSGPGSIEVIVSGTSLGGVLLQVDGTGIRGFSALGDARVYSAADAGRPDRHRVVAITPGGGSIRIAVEVDDLGMDGPVVTVLQATRVDNALVPPSVATVIVER